MGIIKAATNAIGGTLAEQWLEVVEPSRIDNKTFLSFGVRVNRQNSRDSNTKGTADVISNGSVIHVPENTYMLLVDGGKIISMTDESGYYKVDNSSAPSILFSKKEDESKPAISDGNQQILRSGSIMSTLKDSWERFKFGGTTPQRQKVYYVNKQEIPDIRFGTKNPVSYTDRALVPGRVVPCKITSFGSYSVRISDPILFFNEVSGKSNSENFTIDDLSEQYLNEFLMAYTTSLSKLSMENILVSDIPIKTLELGKYMADVLDDEWLKKRGFYIESVGIAGINFDEKTNELLDKYANDSILLDPNTRAARMTGGLSEGLKAAGSNEGGAMIGFAGMTMGMNAAGAMGAMPNQQQPQQQAPQQQTPLQQTQNNSNSNLWECKCGSKNSEDSKFCPKCGEKKQLNTTWNCKCGKENLNSSFCPTCGNKKPESLEWQCDCGKSNTDMFCPGCGNKKP